MRSTTIGAGVAFALSATASIAIAGQASVPDKPDCWKEGSMARLVGTLRAAPAPDRRLFAGKPFPVLVLSTPVCFSGMSAARHPIRIAVVPEAASASDLLRQVGHKVTIEGSLSEGVWADGNPQEEVFMEHAVLAGR